MNNVNNLKMFEAYDAAIGKTISEARLEADALKLRFTDGTAIGLYDDGQSCCEKRYMTTDEDLFYYTGTKFLGAEVKDATTIDDNCEVHEIQFLEIQTSEGVFTMANHNEHNGYYSGFLIRVRPLEE